MPAPSIITVDVEDYFQVEAFAGTVDRATWQDYPSRVEHNTERILHIFDDLNVKATFFILGWVAEHYPALVRRIREHGHEVACHSYWHRLVYKLTPDDFREDTLRAKHAIEQAAGVAIYGYRAPSFSITRQSTWALEILAQLGFVYDSSIFPVRHDLYGYPDAHRGPFRVETARGAIVEFPMATFRLPAGPNLPVAGGGYLRIFPRWYTRAGVRSAWREGLPVVSYIHSWELDAEQPRIHAPLKSRLRHYTNLRKTQRRLRELLALGEFTSFRDSGILHFRSTSTLAEAVSR
ncbi:MAG: DUF3473 domain-containing protein [Acidobacteriia bacterium]|nr:DUF3473 domain-containing protein [Terriglobia bacterium]